MNVLHHQWKKSKKSRVEKRIDAWSKRKGHQRLRWLGREIFHIILTFIVGVTISVLYHEFVTNKAVRMAAERICTVYGRDEQECKENIDTVLQLSDSDVQNNVVIKGE